MTFINFEKLASVPYMKDYSVNPEFQSMVNKWINIWSAQSELSLEHAALIRAVECTNGCVQYAYRDGEDFALDIDKTRVCMKISMTIMNTKRIECPDGSVIEIDPTIHDLLDEVREIYISGFKRSNDEKLMEFYAQSVAQFYVIGEDKLNEALCFVKNNYENIFTPYFLERGRQYIFKYLNAIEEVPFVDHSELMSIKIL